jgi:hypothetical protein
MHDALALLNARKSWGDYLPDWVESLARESDRTSQAAAGRAIGRSAALVNQVIKRSYKGDLTAVEPLVRGALMNEVVDCPVMGELATNICLENQDAKFSAHNHIRVQLYRACKTCEHRRNHE